jgi:hypothetical protein
MIENGGEALPVGRLAFKAREGRQTVLSGFDSHSLPPIPGLQYRHNVAQVDMYQRCARPGGRLDRIIMRRNMSAYGSLLITGAGPWFPRSCARLPGEAG